MKNVAIIPARGGSKRIPRKNIRLFSGKPMIAYSIAAAIDSGVFDRVVVTTDDDEIANVAKRYGAEIPFMRPSELSDDHAGTDAVLQHALTWLQDHGEKIDNACCIYATAPFVQAHYIRLGLEILRSRQATSAFSVTSFAYPVFRSLKTLPEGRVVMQWPEYLMSRSQDLPEVVHDAGQFYWMNVEKYFVAGKLLNDNAYPVYIPRYLVQDIDTLEDWEMAEKMYAVLHGTMHSTQNGQTLGSVF